MKTLRESLAEKGVLTADGGWGSLLMAQGLTAGECPELWNVERPEVLRDIAAQYAEAGSDIVSTNSFGGSRIKLTQYGLGERTAELNEAAARLSREAAGDAVHVMASMGPTGKFLMMGDVSEEALYDAFREQALAFERGGADSVIVETMAALDEACCAVRAVRENTRLDVVCSFTYASENAGVFHTMMGVTPAQTAAGALDAGAQLLGANCSFGSEQMLGVVRALHEAAPDVPILVNPNAGQPQHTDAGDVYPETPEIMASYTPRFIEAGAGIVGACCGSTPAHIRAIANAVAAARRAR